jgi:hypothetical protein
VSFEHITTLEQFRALSPEDQAAAAAERKSQAEDKYRAIVNEAYDRFHLEHALVPRLRFKAVPPAPPIPPVRVEVGPSISSDPDTAVKEFFNQHPNARQILIGDVLYERSRR